MTGADREELEPHLAVMTAADRDALDASEAEYQLRHRVAVAVAQHSLECMTVPIGPWWSHGSPARGGWAISSPRTWPRPARA